MFYKFIHYQFTIKHEKSEDINSYGSIGFIKIERYICRHLWKPKLWHGHIYLKHLGVIVVHFHHKIINNYCHRVKDPFIFTAWPQDTFSIIFLWITYFFWISYKFKQLSSFSMKWCLYKDFLIEIMQAAVRSSLLMVLLDRNNGRSKSQTLFHIYDTQHIWNLEMAFELHHQFYKCRV